MNSHRRRQCVLEEGKFESMIRQIVRDTIFLSRKSEKATAADLHIAKDLEDTLRANHDRCVGMAANMIGYSKSIIIVATGFADIVMINPIIMTGSNTREEKYDLHMTVERYMSVETPELEEQFIRK